MSQYFINKLKKCIELKNIANQFIIAAYRGQYNLDKLKSIYFFYFVD